MLGTREARQAALAARYPTWEKQTLDQALDRAADRWPQAPLVITEEETHTYAQLRALSQRAAVGLRRLGVAAGDHVAVRLPNGAEYVALTFALARLGAVKVPLNLKLGRDELGYVLGQSQSAFYLGREPLAQALVEELPLLRGALTLDGDGWRRLTAGEDDAPPDAGAPDGLSDLIYTSGSTGRPKGVMLTHDMLLRSAYASCLNRGFEEGRRIYVPLPLFHVYGYVEGLLTALFVGGAVLLSDSRFDPDRGLRFMARAGANDILSVPGVMMGLLRSPLAERTDLSALHAVYCSASVCPPWLWHSIRAVLGVSDLITGYGMTEVCGATLQTLPSDGDEVLLSRVGRLLPGGCAGVAAWGGAQTQYRVAHQETGAPLPPGQVGELWCRGPVVTRGYFDSPQANAAAFAPGGWLRTGDLGRFDEAGYLELTGRCSDLYKTNGENVSPKYVEEQMARCPLVRHVEVVGIPDPRRGEAGAAFVELDGVTSPEEAAGLIDRHCRRRLAPFQVPSHLFFLTHDQWPLTATGKITKQVLRQMARERAGEGGAAWSGSGTP